MIVNYFKSVDAFQIVNFFTQEEYSKMWVELSYLCNDEMLLPPTESGGTVKRTSRGLPIESFMESSDIISIMDKIYKEEFLEYIIDNFPSYENLRLLKKQTHLINHYMEGQQYGYHKDNCEFTAITIFHKIPKLYDGGLLTFRQNDSIINIPLMPRDLLLFHANTDHAVSPIQFNDGVDKTNMNGRISVSKFIK